ncbi:MAG: hypothetical protein J6Z74_03795 [Eubacterium sp.]|nr:hypothetical protein [Eubacterium sp.]
MKKINHKSTMVGVILLLILAFSITGCGKKSDNYSEQIKQLLGPEKTDDNAAIGTENPEGAAKSSEAVPENGTVESGTAENGAVQEDVSDKLSTEKAVDNPIFVRGVYQKNQNSTIYDFYYLNLETGEMNLFFTFKSGDVDIHEDIKNLITNSSNNLGHEKLYNPAIRADMLFNEDMTAIAVQWRESDQSSHVGWCDSDGNVTDVTKKIYNTKSDFDLLPNNHYPLFGPDNSLWFYDYNLQTYRKYNIDTGRVEDPEEQLLLGMTEILYVIYGEQRIRRNNIGSGSLIYSGNSIEKYNYINERDQYTPLIPETDWRIQHVAYSGGKIVFDATRGDQYKVFVIDNMNGISEPKAVYSEKHSFAGDNPMLLFWRDPELRSDVKKLAENGGKEKSEQTTVQQADVKTEEKKEDKTERTEESSGDGQPEGKKAFFDCGRIYVDDDRLLHIDERFFGMTYDELARELDMSVPEPTDFPGWGMELESSEIYVDGESIVLIFQDDKLAVVDYEYQGIFDEDQWQILCDKTGIKGERDKFDDYKDRGLLDPKNGICYYYINYDYEQNGRGDLLIQKYYWRGMKWD